MRYTLFFIKLISFLLLFIYASKIHAQNYSIKGDTIFVFKTGTNIEGDELSPAERDSLKRGVTPWILAQRWENKHKKYLIQRDSIIQTFIGQPVPDFDAQDTEGFKHKPHLYRGRVLVLHFWHFWDDSFQNEIPALNDLAGKYRQDGLEILSFTDVPYNKPEQEYLRQRPIHFPLIENAKAFSQAFLGIRIFAPFIIFIDKNGIIKHIYLPEKLTVNRGNMNEKAADFKLPTYDFEERIKELIK